MPKAVDYNYLNLVKRDLNEYCRKVGKENSERVSAEERVIVQEKCLRSFTFGHYIARAREVKL